MSTALAHASDFSADQVDLIKRTIAKGSTDDELRLFVSTAQRLGLDPFARQIFAVKRYDSKERREVMSIQVSIDGFRLVAQRSAEYAGQDGPYWCGKDGVWHDIWTADEAPFAARVGVFRRGFTGALYAVARFDAYAQRTKEGNLNAMWSRMGDLMIAKCAEALALRRAFPAELSGVYTSDEMGQAADVEVVEPNTSPEAARNFEAAVAGTRAPAPTRTPLDELLDTDLGFVEDDATFVAWWERVLPLTTDATRKRVWAAALQRGAIINLEERDVRPLLDQAKANLARSAA